MRGEKARSGFGDGLEVSRYVRNGVACTLDKTRVPFENGRTGKVSCGGYEARCWLGSADRNAVPQMT